MRVPAAILLLSVALSIAIVLRSPNESGTLDGLYTDSMRQIYSSWLFVRYGSAVFKEPLGDLAKRDASPGAKAPWPQHPFLYPPGALLVFTPFGYAQYGLGLSPSAVNRAAIILLVLLAHGSVLVFARELESPALLPTTLYAAVALSWALNGFYDPIYVAFAALGLGAARRDDPVRALLWLGLSSFFHIRAVFYLPVAAHQLGRVYSLRKSLEGRRYVELLAAFLLAAPPVWTFLVTRASLDDVATINLVMEEDFGWGGVAVVVAVTIITALYFYRGHDGLSGIAVAWVGALDLALPFARAWYALALYPLLVLPKNAPRRREVMLLWVLAMSGVAFRHFPSLRWLARGIGLLF